MTVHIYHIFLQKASTICGQNRREITLYFEPHFDTDDHCSYNFTIVPSEDIAIRVRILKSIGMS